MIEEKKLCREALALALNAGAQKARVSIARSNMDLVSTLNGEIDKLTSCFDRSMEIMLFVDGRFGSFSTNRLEMSALRTFIEKAVSSVRLLEEDPARDLPDPRRQTVEAKSGLELGLVDNAYQNMDSEKRLSLALGASVFPSEGKGWKLISEEGEYSDSSECSFLMDSSGLEAAHCETCFSYGVEITVQDARGRKYSGYWWDSSPFLNELAVDGIGRRALELALGQMGTRKTKGGKFNLVVDAEVASKLFSPVLAALNGYSIQQNNSFLLGAVGKKMFPETLSVMDCPHIRGQNGSRLYDSEGVATKEHFIIEKGVVKEYFINTYISRKTGLQPTQEEAIRPKILPCRKGGEQVPAPRNAEELMRMCGNGIYVNDFNGGNSDSATGDFSYGISGFIFENGKIVRPVSEMLITGNFLTLWSALIAAADDARPCRQKLIPSLAFAEVDFSG